MHPNWLIPFRGQNKSGREGVNFLWEWGCVYVMDNHRLGPWCFWQHDQNAPSWRVFHVDQHRDTADELMRWPNLVRPEHRADLKGFLEAESAPGRALFVYDNMLSAALLSDPDRIGLTYMAARNDGWLPEPAEEIDPWVLSWKLEYIVHQNEEDDRDRRPWWIDLDLDYFVDRTHQQLFADDQIARIGRTLYEGVQNGAVKVLTIALSPECCGGWPAAERLLAVLTGSWPDDGRPRLP